MTLSVAGATDEEPKAADFFFLGAVCTICSGKYREMILDIKPVAKMSTVKNIKTVPIPNNIKLKPCSISELVMILIKPNYLKNMQTKDSLSDDLNQTKH